MAAGMILRAATSADTPAIADLGARAFVAKFGHLYSAGNLARFLSETHTCEKVAVELAHPGMQIAVIETDGRIVAYAKIIAPSTMPRDHSDAKGPVELKQLYTDPHLTGQGHGSRLMQWALDRARDAGGDELQLSVYSANRAAQRFYARFGMTRIADTTFQVGDHVDLEFMMAVRLG